MLQTTVCNSINYKGIYKSQIDLILNCFLFIFLINYCLYESVWFLLILVH